MLYYSNIIVKSDYRRLGLLSMARPTGCVFYLLE